MQVIREADGGGRLKWRTQARLQRPLQMPYQPGHRARQLGLLPIRAHPRNPWFQTHHTTRFHSNFEFLKFISKPSSNPVIAK
jgi:hypothetical protein